ncbi:hypothetical protein KR009_012282 [Drosophila setifemur]|nr:hypothetical protein KR009_012282 [Drosophila setifemur]
MFCISNKMDQGTRKRRTLFVQDNNFGNKKARASPLNFLQNDKNKFKKFSSDLLNLPPIPKINAFERGHEVESILDIVQNSYNEQLLYIKFSNLPDPELVPLDVVLEKVPHLMPSFYKEYAEAYQNLEHN